MYMSIINTSSNTISTTEDSIIMIIITTSQSILLKQHSTSHFISIIKHLRSSRSNNWVSILTNLLGDLPADPDWHFCSGCLVQIWSGTATHSCLGTSTHFCSGTSLHTGWATCLSLVLDTSLQVSYGFFLQVPAMGAQTLSLP